MVESEVFLGLGSNIGNRRGYLHAAIHEISQYVENIKFSSLYESRALLADGAPKEWAMPFYNMVLTGKTKLSAQEMLSVVKQIEATLSTLLHHPARQPRVPPQRQAPQQHPELNWKND